MTEMIHYTAPTANPVFYRTYSRIKEDGRKESLQEAKDRSFEGLKRFGLYTDEEADLAKKYLDQSLVFVSGRWLWIGGTEWVDNPKNYLGAYNCASIPVDNWDAFRFNFRALLMGCGVGTVIENSVINKLPEIKYPITIGGFEEIGKNWVEGQSLESSYYTCYSLDENTLGINYVVGDSKEGWIDLATDLLEFSSTNLADLSSINNSLLQYNQINIFIDLGYVRPKGIPLKGFGGVSNPEKLEQGLKDIVRILNKAVGRKLSSVEVCDILGIHGVVTVAGSIRRCLPQGSLVLTDKGNKFIEDIEVGTKVLTSKGYYPVLNNFDQGQQPLVQIKTVQGDFWCTAEHKLAVKGKREDLFLYQMKAAKDLTYEDSLVWIPEREFPVTLVSCPVKEVAFTDRVEQTYDLEVDQVHEFICNGYLVSNSARINQGDNFDLDFANSKDNLWTQDEKGNWKIDPEKDMRRFANHTLTYHVKPTLEECVGAVRKQYYSGEGAIQYVPEAVARSNADLLDTPEKKQIFIDKYLTSIRKGANYLLELAPELDDRELEHRIRRFGLNPSLRGDTRLLTTEGYKTLEELEGTTFKIINADGDISDSTVWQTGVKETIELTLLQRTTRKVVKVYCTPDHVFLTSDGRELAAEFLFYQEVVAYPKTEESFVVIDIVPAGVAKVYDFTEPLTNWGVIEGVITHNCGR